MRIDSLFHPVTGLSEGMRALASGAERPGAVAAAQQPGRHRSSAIARLRVQPITHRAVASLAGRCSFRPRLQPPSRRKWMVSASTGDADPPSGNGDGGSGNGDGSNGGGSDGSGDGGEAPNLGSNIWMLAVAAAAALGLFNVGSKQLKLRRQLVLEGLGRQAAGVTADARCVRVLLLSLLCCTYWLYCLRALLVSNMCTCFPPPSSSAAAAAAAAPASSEDVATLTRLTQELFTELVKVRARLDELEEETGIIAGSSGAAPADATVVGSDGGSRRAKGLAVNGSGSGGMHGTDWRGWGGWEAA